jgi:hypothetical protein
MNTLNYIVKKYKIDLSEIPQDKYIYIPDMLRVDLAELFAELNFKTGAEIGVLAGKYTMQICDNNPQAKVYAIDCWRSYEGYVDFTNEYQILGNYHDAIKHLSPYKNCEIMRSTSMEAVNFFKDESLDFVYIDANHLLRYVVDDITEWAKKIRKGGIVAGHDFLIDEKQLWWNHVYCALNAYASAYKIDQIFVLGGERTGHRDYLRSWFFIKQ